jgi:rSAM/selenodomain-associated transferase 1
MMPKQTIALFVKPPIPGQVKTRLAKDIGNQVACDIYYRLADHTVQQVQTSGYPLALFYDGQDLDVLPEQWKKSAQVVCVPQQGNDLGKRMTAAFSCLFAVGIEQVVLIGSDIPGIDAAYLSQAFDLLADHPMVIGPALDGGYCLIGFNSSNFTESVFQNIPWSTNRVLELTLFAVKQAGLSVGLMSPLRDIDTAEDLQYYNKMIQID